MRLSIITEEKGLSWLAKEPAADAPARTVAPVQR